MEANYFRNASSGVPLVLIPNHPLKKTPVPMLHDNYDFTAWLTWRCHKKHGFLATTALINTVLRYLAGLAQYEEATPLWDNVAKVVVAAPHNAHTNSNKPPLKIHPPSVPTLTPPLAASTASGQAAA